MRGRYIFTQSVSPFRDLLFVLCIHFVYAMRILDLILKKDVFFSYD